MKDHALETEAQAGSVRLPALYLLATEVKSLVGFQCLGTPAMDSKMQITYLVTNSPSNVKYVLKF